MQLVDNINAKYKLIIELGYRYLPRIDALAAIG